MPLEVICAAGIACMLSGAAVELVRNEIEERRWQASWLERTARRFRADTLERFGMPDGPLSQSR